MCTVSSVHLQYLCYDNLNLLITIHCSCSCYVQNCSSEQSTRNKNATANFRLISKSKQYFTAYSHVHGIIDCQMFGRVKIHAIPNAYKVTVNVIPEGRLSNDTFNLQ